MTRNPITSFRNDLPDAIRILSPTREHRPLRAPCLPSVRYWKPPTDSHDQLTTTLWGTASFLMLIARLHRLCIAAHHSSPAQWMPRIKTAAQELYLPPRVPLAHWLFTDPAAWHSGRIAALLDRTLPSWPQLAWPPGGHPAALLCWPADHLHECLLDVPDNQRANPLAYVTCPAYDNRPVDGPYLFLGILTRDRNAWVCSDRCAYPIAALDFPVPVDSDHHRDTARALHRLLCTIRDNAELAHLLGGQLKIRIERPLYTLNLHDGACAPDFLIHVHRPEETRHPRISPRHLHPRDRVLYTVELTGLDDPEYEAARRRNYPALETLGRVCHMHVPHFYSTHNSLDRQRERLTSRITGDILYRWRVHPDQTEHSAPSPESPS